MKNQEKRAKMIFHSFFSVAVRRIAMETRAIAGASAANKETDLRDAGKKQRPGAGGRAGGAKVRKKPFLSEQYGKMYLKSC